MRARRRSWVRSTAPGLQAHPTDGSGLAFAPASMLPTLLPLIPFVPHPHGEALARETNAEQDYGYEPSHRKGHFN